MSVKTAASAYRYDLVIVGASFAGLVAAKTAAMRGLRVAVLEAKPEPGYRVATTGILVKEAAEEIDLPHHVTRRVHGVRLYAPNLKHVDLFAPGYFFLTTDTANLLRWLALEALRAGASILYRTRFAGAERHGSVFRFKDLNIEARYILGADGARSAVARHFELSAVETFLVGLEAEYEDLDADPRFLHCFLDSKLAPGYLGWVAPGPKVTQVGLAASGGRRADLAAFQEKTAALFGYQKARVVERRSGRIPASGLVKRWAAPGVMLVGDAAGMVSPATGGGIQLAFRYGRRAAQAIADHLMHLGPAPDVALAPELPGFAVKKLLRFGLDMRPANALLNAALGTAAMRRIASHVYFHRRGGKGLSFDDYMRQLERELPSSGMETSRT